MEQSTNAQHGLGFGEQPHEGTIREGEKLWVLHRDPFQLLEGLVGQRRRAQVFPAPPTCPHCWLVWSPSKEQRVQGAPKLRWWDVGASLCHCVHPEGCNAQPCAATNTLVPALSCSPCSGLPLCFQLQFGWIFCYLFLMHRVKTIWILGKSFF